MERIHAPTGWFYSEYDISSGTLVPNSRDSHEKNGNRVFHTSKKALATWQKPTEMQL